MKEKKNKTIKTLEKNIKSLRENLDSLSMDGKSKDSPWVGKSKDSPWMRVLG